MNWILNYAPVCSKPCQMQIEIIYVIYNKECQHATRWRNENAIILSPINISFGL